MYGETMMKTFYRINQYKWKDQCRHTFRSGRSYLVVLLTHGSCHIVLKEKECPCLSSDMLLLKPGQVKTLYTSVKGASCHAFAVRIPVETLTRFSDDTCDFLKNFQFAPYDTTMVHAEIESFAFIRNLVSKLASLKEEEISLGMEIYEKSLFASFLVLFLRACVQSDQVHQLHQKKQLMIDNVFQYISRHLTEDLSLKTLEREFFVSGEHISREFKKSAGVTLHSYIVKSRVDLSKKYILQGISIHDVSQMCGFGSYNHFFKVFKKECHMTPMDYYRSVVPDSNVPLEFPPQD